MITAALRRLLGVWPASPMGSGAPRAVAQMRGLIGRWIFVRIRTTPEAECYGRLVAVDERGFTMETLDGRPIAYYARPREILCVGELAGQEALQLAWAENLERQADLAGRH